MSFKTGLILWGALLASLLAAPMIWAEESLLPQLQGPMAIEGGRLSIYPGQSGLIVKGTGLKSHPELPQGEERPRLLVLNFFATWCIPCRREIPTFNRLAERYRGTEVRLLYVSVDQEVAPKRMAKFIELAKIKVPMMLPPPKDTMKRLGIRTLPQLWVIDSKGKIRHRISGFEPGLEDNLDAIIRRLR